MARSVNLTAELEPRPSDVAIPDLLFPKLPPFSDLKSTAKLANFPGAVILRRFKEGEVICRQGDPGWTAFYIPTGAELATIREAPRAQAAIAEAEVVKAEAKAAELKVQLAEAGGDPRKAEGLRNKLVEATEQLADSKDRLALLRAAIPSLEEALRETARDGARTPLIAAGDRALASLGQALEEASARGDEAIASRLRGALAADAATKRVRADQLETEAPEVAAWLRQAARAEEARKVASVQLSIPLPRSKGPKGLLARIGLRSSDARRKKKASRPPAWIPIDGPRDLDYETREGQLNEGELFGEMSCLYRAPRSATVVAVRDCFLLEMLRNVLEAMNRDAGFKSRLDRVYRERVLRLQLRNLPILLELDERLLERLSQQAELVEIPSGGILYDENEPSDGMHLIRGGILRVMQNVSFLLGERDVTDWPALRAELLAAEDPSSGPPHRLWCRLGEGVRSWLRETPDPRPDAAPGAPRAVLDALNEQIKDPELEVAAGLEGVALAQRAGRKAWQRLAAPGRGSEREMVRCQRLLMDAVYGSKLPEGKPAAAAAGGDSPHDYRVEDFRDWKAAAAALFEGSTREAEPRRRVWDRLSEPARAAIRAAKASGEVSEEGRQAIVESLNVVLRTRPFLVDPVFQEFLASKKPAKLIMEFLPGNQGWEEHDFHRCSRAFNRDLLDALFPKGLGTSRRPEGPPRTLAYRSRGEAIGEMSLVEGKVRMATCVAYGHPEDDPGREVGPIQLVRISRELFEELKEASPGFRRHLEDLVAERQAQSKAVLARDRTGAPAAARSDRAEELGLLQGQRLMLIDLERCTRCDECVQACVDTHDDGRSRLFLDGPRFGKFLVPTTCRSCLDPVCMIGCPVGAIHRGGNGEIIIEDWCIGCEACADQCPYGAIQMHKEGVIPESSFGWRFAPAASLPDGWVQRGFRDGDWSLGRAPFVHDREFLARLRESRGGRDRAPGAIAFRYEFDVASELLDPNDHFILSLTTMDEAVAVWINGRPIVTSPADPRGTPGAGTVSRRKSRDNGWWEVEAELPTTAVNAGRNVLAARVTPDLGGSDRLLDLRMDREMGATVKLVDQKAVVCDLCSAQYGQRPACVTACPHDAAIRVNALSQLPLL